MYNRTVRDVGHSFAQNFVRKGGGISFPEEEEAEDICNRVSFLPLEIDVRDAAGEFLDVNKESRDRVGDHGAAGIEDAVVANPASFHVELLVEFRGVGALHFEEDE